MAEDPQRAKARATFGKAFMENAKPKPLAKNTATASQKVANSRPIPTYKNGGAVKKADGGVMPSRIAARIKAGNYKDGGETFDYNKGGKVGKYANGGILDRVAQAISDIANQDKMKKYGIPKGERPSAPSGSGAQRSGSASGRGNNTPVTVTSREESVTVTPTAAKTQTVTPTAAKTQTVKLNEKPKYVKLNPHKDGGKVQTSADTARKLATEMGGMKDGGSCGMKPVKKAVGGAGKIRKGQAPIRKKDGGVAEKAAGGMMTEAQYEANMRAQRATRQAPPAAPRSSRRPAVDDLSPEYLKRRELRQKGIIPQSEMQATRNLAFRNRQAMDKNIRQQDIRVKGSDVGMSGADADQYFYVSRPGGGASDELVRAVAGPKQVVKMGDFTDQFSAQNQRIYDNLKAQGAIMKKGGVVKKKDGGTIKLDLNQIKRDTAMRDAAAKKRAEAERYRRMMGSQEDILRRGERGQARDTEEYRSMKPERRAKGGAGKVRKGMMTGKGDIRQAVKPKKGIGGFM